MAKPSAGRFSLSTCNWIFPRLSHEVTLECFIAGAVAWWRTHWLFMNSITSAEAWHSSSIYWRRKRSYKVIYRYAECDEARVRTDLFAGGPHVSVDLMFALWFVVSLVSTKRGVKDVTERSHVVFKDTLQLPCLDYPPGLSACPRLCSAYFARLCRVKYSGNGRRVSLPFSSIIDFRVCTSKW